MKSFVKSFIATVVGDNNEATAQKALRQADSALQSQIASLKGDTIGLEDNLSSAKEKQDLARVNGGALITSREYYVRGLLSAKNSVTDAEEALKAHKEKIAFLESELKALDNDAE